MLNHDIYFEQTFYSMTNKTCVIHAEYMEEINDRYLIQQFAKDVRKALVCMDEKFARRLKEEVLYHLAKCSNGCVSPSTCMYQLVQILDKYGIYLADADYERADFYLQQMENDEIKFFLTGR